MFSSNNGYSLADIAAVTDGNRGGFFGNGFGGDGWWIIILFLFAFGGFGFVGTPKQLHASQMFKSAGGQAVLDPFFSALFDCHNESFL